jgi:enoyl-CoA hydratase/carnithine racemase
MTDLLARNTDDNGITTLTLNQPERRNSLSMGMLDALAEALADIATDDTTRVVVIAAAGKVFCAVSVHFMT